MKRSTEPRDNSLVGPNDHLALSTTISGVCSECGMTYQVEAAGGNEAWMCPRCGPSTPIGVRDTADERGRRRQRTKRLPRVRVPFLLVQLLIVSLTFVLFMGFVLNYMNRRFPARRSTDRGPKIAGLVRPGADLPRDPMLPLNNRQQAQAGPANPAAARDSSDQSADGSGSEPSTFARELASTGEQATGTTAARDASAAAAMPAAARTAPAGPTDPAAQFTLDAPTSCPAHCVSIRDIIDHSARLFGQQVVLQCRLARICHDALGQVPRRFDIDGERIQLSEQDEQEFVRLEVVDARGQSLRCVFVRVDGPLRQDLEWVMPGDWLLLTATPGLRYPESSAAAADWGLVVIRVDAIEEHSHDQADFVTKQLAER